MTDPSMKLPEGKTCGDCAYWKRCKSFISSLDQHATHCDWSPSKFIEAPVPGSIQAVIEAKDSLEGKVDSLESEVERLKRRERELEEKVHLSGETARKLKELDAENEDLRGKLHIMSRHVRNVENEDLRGRLADLQKETERLKERALTADIVAGHACHQSWVLIAAVRAIASVLEGTGPQAAAGALRHAADQAVMAAKEPREPTGEETRLRRIMSRVSLYLENGKIRAEEGAAMLTAALLGGEPEFEWEEAGGE